MGFAAPVIDLRPAEDDEVASVAMDSLPAPIVIRGAPAAAPRNTRLDSIVIPSSFGCLYMEHKHTAIRRERDWDSPRTARSPLPRLIPIRRCDLIHNIGRYVRRTHGPPPSRADPER